MKEFCWNVFARCIPCLGQVKKIQKSTFIQYSMFTYKKGLLCYYLCCRLCVSSFGSFPIFCFPSDPWFLRLFPFFLRQILLLLYPPGGTTCTVHEWGGGGVSQGWRVGVLGLLCLVKCAWNSTCQPDSLFWIPVRIPVLKGTGESISADHTWVIYCNSDCYSTVYSPLWLRNVFFPFLCYGSTQLHEYVQGLPP